jgi:ABC-type transport system involved in cytochrome c biogenesis ATPase subunit
MTVNFPIRMGAPGLTDRRSERGVLDRFVDEVRAGEGRALVVRGEPGVGKTVLLDYLAGQAGPLRNQPRAAGGAPTGPPGAGLPSAL